MNDPITTAQVVQWVCDHIWQLILAFSIFFEITPIKINPISWLIGLLFKPVYKKIDEIKAEVKQEMQTVKTDLQTEMENVKSKQEQCDLTTKELIQSNEMTEISRIRWEILEFANTIENGQLHTKDEYRHIQDDCRRYHELIAKYNLTNNSFTEEYAKIDEHYQSYKDSNSVYF